MFKALVLCLTLSEYVFASGLTFGASGSVECLYNVVRHQNVDVSTLFSYHHDVTGANAVNASCPTTLLDPFPNLPPAEMATLNWEFGHGSASIGGSFGDLSGTAEGIQYVHAMASGAFSDSITVSGVATGVIRFTLVMDGVRFFLPGLGPFFPGSYGALIVDGVTVGSPYTAEIPPTPTTPVRGSVQFEKPFAGGVAVPFGATLQVEAFGLDADYMAVRETLLIEVLDENGHRLSNVQVLTESGTVYAESVPEPASLVAIATGLAVMALRRRLA